MAKQEYLWQSFSLPDAETETLPFHELEALRSFDVQLDHLRVAKTRLPNNSQVVLLTPKGRSVVRYDEPDPENGATVYTYGAFYDPVN